MRLFLIAMLFAVSSLVAESSQSIEQYIADFVIWVDCDGIHEFYMELEDGTRWHTSYERDYNQIMTDGWKLGDHLLIQWKEDDSSHPVYNVDRNSHVLITGPIEYWPL